jgi:hypothetical protein
MTQNEWSRMPNRRAATARMYEKMPFVLDDGLSRNCR